MQFGLELLVVAVLLLCIVLIFTNMSLKRKVRDLTRQNSEKTEYEKLFLTLPVPICYKNSSSDALFTNRSFDIAFGANRAKTIQFLSKSIKDPIEQTDLLYDNDIVKKVIVFSSNILDDRYEKSGRASIVFDINDFKKEIASLLVWKQRYTLAIEGPKYGLWDWKIPENSFYSSSIWKEIMGYESGEKSNNLNSWLSLVDTRDMAKVNEALNIHLKGQSDLFEIEHRVRLSKDVKWVSVRGKALFDSDNNAIKMSGLIFDISEKKKAELCLNESQKLFISYVTNLPGLAFIKDENSRYLYINRYFEEFIGYIEWEKRTPVDIFDGKTAKMVIENDKEALYQDKKIHKEVITNEQGVQKYFEIYRFIIKNEKSEKLLCGFGIETNSPQNI